MWLALTAAVLGQAPMDLETTTPARELVARTRVTESVDQLLDDGRHQRFGTTQGPVHVWRPRAYKPATAVTIVYVHGFFTDVEQAHRQPPQEHPHHEYDEYQNEQLLPQRTAASVDG